MKKWQQIVINILWSIAAAALILLFVVSWKAKSEKQLTDIIMSPPPPPLIRAFNYMRAVVVCGSALKRGLLNPFLKNSEIFVAL